MNSEKLRKTVTLEASLAQFRHSEQQAGEGLRAESEEPLPSREGQILVHLLTSQLVMVSGDMWPVTREPMNQHSIPGGDTGQAANFQLSHLGRICPRMQRTGILSEAGW